MTEVLQIKQVRKDFATRSSAMGRERAFVRAVDGVDISVRAGETLALVGESGCGKSTLSKLAVGLLRPTAGQVLINGHDISPLSRGELRKARRAVGMVFQDPYSSLDPRFTALSTVAEPLRAWGAAGREATSQAEQMLERMGLDPARFAHRYPAEFSGGQRQRIGIARALILKPSLLVADEPVSALDVSVQAQVINLLSDLQEELGLGCLFVAHDLSVVRHLADRVAVMYSGRIIETGPVRDVYERPAHPYTQSLLSAVPIVHPSERSTRNRAVPEGEPPKPATLPSGCNFRARCPHAQAVCAEVDPQLDSHGIAGRAVACHFAGLLPPGNPQFSVERPVTRGESTAPRTKAST